MESVMKNKIRIDAIGVFLSIFVLGTAILDRIIMVIARPYLLHYLNALLNKNSKIADRAAKIYYLAVYVEGYYIIVFHLLVLIAVFVVFFNDRFKFYKRELLYSYLIVIIAGIFLLIIRHWIKR